MRVLSLTHEQTDPSGVFGLVARAAGHDLDEANYAHGRPPEAPVGSYDAMFVFGGTMHTHQEEHHPWLREEKEAVREALEADVPFFGVCLGGQILAGVAGAPVRRMETPEIGWYELELTDEAADDPIFSGLPESFPSFQWHAYQFDLPEGGVPLARTASSLQAFRVGDQAWGVQFHPEVEPPVLEHWIDHYATDEDAIRLGLAVDEGKAEARGKIARWNEHGRTMCGRFLELVAARV